jgi:benzoyl-CoA reductase/2-hydroxyglutaryl-CoA dehydratase subunit BcrC/BadD/HgdB
MNLEPNPSGKSEAAGSNCSAAGRSGTPGQTPPASPGQLPPLQHFARMVDNCYEYAEVAKAQGRPIVGIMCEFTPREIILAAGGVPVCLCGGSAEMVGPAEQYLPANLCPLIKSTFGYHITGRNPFLNWADLLVAETTCDGKKKMFELLGASKPMYVLELPQKANDPEALENWVKEVNKFKEYLEARFEVKITGAKLHEAILLMNQERRLRRELADLMMADPPPLTGRQLIEFKSLISGIPSDLAQYEQAIEQYNPEKRDPKAEASPKSNGRILQPRDARRPVRVLMTGVPLVHGAERVLEIIESCGAVVVCMENCTGIKPILEDVDVCAPDPVRAIAEKYYHLPCSVMTLNEARLKSLRSLTARFRPDCVIDLIWQACLTYDVESYRVRDFVEKELRLPYLKISTDYSPADSARISARVEALFEIVRNSG